MTTSNILQELIDSKEKKKGVELDAYISNVQKVCTGCNESKPVTDFYKDATKALGVKPKCKECCKKKRTYPPRCKMCLCRKTKAKPLHKTPGLYVATEEMLLCENCIESLTRVLGPERASLWY